MVRATHITEVSFCELTNPSYFLQINEIVGKQYLGMLLALLR